MSTLHVNFKANAAAPSAVYEAITTSAVHAVSTNEVRGVEGDIELYVVGGSGLLVSINPAPNAQTDQPGRFFLPPDYPICVKGVGQDCKVSAVDA